MKQDSFEGWASHHRMWVTSKTVKSGTKSKTAVGILECWVDHRLAMGIGRNRSFSLLPPLECAFWNKMLHFRGIAIIISGQFRAASLQIRLRRGDLDARSLSLSHWQVKSFTNKHFPSSSFLSSSPSFELSPSLCPSICPHHIC